MRLLDTRHPHKIKSDEIWHFYQGSPLWIHEINAKGDLYSHLLGNPEQFNEAKFQVAIRAGNWFSAEPVVGNGFAFVGCTVSPGFEFRDFTLADRGLLLTEFPQHEAIIMRLTRVQVDDKNDEIEVNIGMRSIQIT